MVFFTELDGAALTTGFWTGDEAGKRTTGTDTGLLAGELADGTTAGAIRVGTGCIPVLFIGAVGDDAMTGVAVGVNIGDTTGAICGSPFGEFNGVKAGTIAGDALLLEASTGVPLELETEN